MTAQQLTLMRHGATGRPSYRGQLDDALSELGWAQSRAATAGGDWDIVISSTLRRCAGFAAALSAQRKLPLRLDARLMEYHFGAWQGRPITELEREKPRELAAYRADPAGCPPPGGEDFAAFGARISAALDDIATLPAQRTLVITHGAVIRWVQCRLAGIPFAARAETAIANASLHDVDWSGRSVAGRAGRPPISPTMDN